jgi:hypothetical protein
MSGGEYRPKQIFVGSKVFSAGGRPHPPLENAWLRPGFNETSMMKRRFSFSSKNRIFLVVDVRSTAKDVFIQIKS